MGFDCGFDIYPRLEASSANQAIYQMFLDDITNKYQDTHDENGREANGKILDHSSSAYIQFMVGECPRIPKDPQWCNYFLRFSSKVSGSLAAPARPHMKDVYQIAKSHFGDRVEFWHEMNEDGEEWQQRRHYGWNEVHEAHAELKALAAKEE